jgi:hypothetical protein
MFTQPLSGSSGFAVAYGGQRALRIILPWRGRFGMGMAEQDQVAHVTFL